MAQHTTMKTIGLDLSDKTAAYAVLDEAGTLERKGKLELSVGALRKHFGKVGRTVVALEVGTHSPWVSRVLEELGHEVVIANPRQVPLISRAQKKTDYRDAETLARLARTDTALLSPIRHRSQESQEELALIHARDQLVQVRTALINHVRGTVKAHGERLPACSAGTFARKVREAIPEGLRPALFPLLEAIALHTQRIRDYDKQVAAACRERYPETAALQQVTGVGPLTALTYVLTIEEPGRFERSRKVGAYLGLVPRQQQSGELSPQLHITHAGDQYLRKLLVQCAHYILGPFGPDCQLRRWGLRLAGRGSVAQKKRALIAVARKLAVLLHRLWATGEIYDPFYGVKEESMAA